MSHRPLSSLSAASAARDYPELAGECVLVTGAAGFIGSHLVDALLERGAWVRALDNLSTGRLENLNGSLERVEFLQEDIRSLNACRRACDGAVFVFHQAALGSVPRSLADPSTTIGVNVEGTANVFAAAREAGVRRVVYASSSSVYGDSSLLPRREGEEGRPLSVYALSKSVDEQMARTFCDCYGMELVGLRYFNVYGPRQNAEGPYAAVLPRFFSAYLAGAAPVIYGDGEQSRDFTFVSDVVAANLLAAAAPREACGRAYNVGGGGKTTIRELAESVRRVVGGGPDPLLSAPRAGDVLHSQADLTLSRRHLGYEPGWDLENGLSAARSHYEATFERRREVRRAAAQ